MGNWIFGFFNGKWKQTEKSFLLWEVEGRAEGGQTPKW